MAHGDVIFGDVVLESFPSFVDLLDIGKHDLACRLEGLRHLHGDGVSGDRRLEKFFFDRLSLGWRFRECQLWKA